MNYDYYKRKYKKYTVQLDREKDADVIRFIESHKGGFKKIFVTGVRYLMLWLLVGGEEDEDIQTK